MVKILSFSFKEARLVFDYSEIIATIWKYNFNLLNNASFTLRYNINIAQAALQKNHEFIKYITGILKYYYDLFSFVVE